MAKFHQDSQEQEDNKKAFVKTMKLILANPKRSLLVLVFAIISATSYGFLLVENQKIEKEETAGFKEVLLENETIVPTAFLLKKVISQCSKLYR